MGCGASSLGPPMATGVKPNSNSAEASQRAQANWEKGKDETLDMINGFGIQTDNQAKKANLVATLFKPSSQATAVAT